MPVLLMVFIGVAVILVGERYMDGTATFMNAFRAFNCPINYLTLMIAYFVRFKEHKEAGLVDAIKN